MKSKSVNVTVIKPKQRIKTIQVEVSQVPKLLPAKLREEIIDPAEVDYDPFETLNPQDIPKLFESSIHEMNYTDRNRTTAQLLGHVTWAICPDNLSFSGELMERFAAIEPEERQMLISNLLKACSWATWPHPRSEGACPRWKTDAMNHITAACRLINENWEDQLGKDMTVAHWVKTFRIFLGEK